MIRFVCLSCLMLYNWSVIFIYLFSGDLYSVTNLKNMLFHSKMKGSSPTASPRREKEPKKPMA